MIISDTVNVFRLSMGTRDHLDITLRPDSSRVSDDWGVDPTSPQVLINGEHISLPEDLFTALWTAKSVQIEAHSTGSTNDKITEANFIIQKGFISLPATVNTGTKQKSFQIPSIRHTIGRLHHFEFEPNSGPILVIDPSRCSFIFDDDLITSMDNLVTALMRSVKIIATPYLNMGGGVVNLELDIDDS